LRIPRLFAGGLRRFTSELQKSFCCERDTSARPLLCKHCCTAAVCVQRKIWKPPNMKTPRNEQQPPNEPQPASSAAGPTTRCHRPSMPGPVNSIRGLHKSPELGQLKLSTRLMADIDVVAKRGIILDVFWKFRRSHDAADIQPWRS
jgi:hypothetical protein